MAGAPIPDWSNPDDPYHLDKYQPSPYGGGYSSSSHTGGGSTEQLINGQWYYVSSRTGYKSPIPGVVVRPIGGVNYSGYINPDGTFHVLGQYTPGKAKGRGVNLGGLLTGGGNSGPTWYEQQQIALDKQRIAQAAKAQAFQEAQALEAKRLAESNAVEAANQAFRDAQLKSTYGTINGMAYAGAKGSPFAEKLPEPLLLKQYYADNKQTDPWTRGPQVGGYTGSGYMNAEQPGIFNITDANMQIPKTGPGSIIQVPPDPNITPKTAAGAAAVPSAARGGTVGTPDRPQIVTSPNGYSVIAQRDAGPVVKTPYDYSVSGKQIPGYAAGGQIPGTTGQPQLIMAHGGEHIIPAPGTPMPALLGSPGGAPFSNPTDPNDPMSQGEGAPIASQDDSGSDDPNSGGDIQAFIMNLIQAAQALVTNPGFAKLGIPMGPPSGDSTGSAPIPGMAMGGVVPSYAAGGVVTDRGGANQSAPGTPGDRDVNQSPAVTPDDRGAANQSSNDALFMPQGPNAYGQTTGDDMVHSPTYNDILPGQGVLNHMPYSPVLTGLSGYGATMTRNGTPVVMSNWQRSHLMPSSVSGPGGYEDYAMQVAGWNPTDLQALGNRASDFGSQGLVAPRNYAPFVVNPAPSGG